MKDLCSWSALTVGVADIDAALELWVAQFGFEIAARLDGHDPALAELWGLEPSDIAGQAMLRVRNNKHGMLHLVQFNDPSEPVRKGAQNFDCLPKNIDVYIRDLPSKVRSMRDSGVVFKADTHSKFTAEDGTQFREIHLAAHDLLNVVLLEVIGQDYEFSERDAAGVGPFVLTVDDAATEAAFFSDVLGVELLNQNTFSGPEIERAIGLPSGTSLNISILGCKGADLGKLEIVEYQGVNSTNLYHRAQPKSLGILHLNYVVNDLRGLEARLASLGVAFVSHSQAKLLISSGRLISFKSPAGLTVYVAEPR